MAASREERLRGYRLERYFTHCEASMMGESPYHYRKGVLQLVRWCDQNGLDVWSLSPLDLDDFVTRPRKQDRVKPSLCTIRTEQVKLRHFFAFCSRHFGIPNPAEHLRPIKVKPGKPKPIDLAWVTRALQAERNPTWKVVLLLACDAGLRRSEIAGLRWSRVDFEHGVMLVLGKGGKERPVPFGGRLAKAFRKVEGLHPTHVVTYARGRNRYPCHPSFITKVVKRSFERVGLDTENNPHRLRATFATDCFRAGVNARVVQELLGHASLATTQVYAEVSAADLREGIAKLRR